MPCDFNILPHEGIQHLSPYVPGKSIAEVSAEQGIVDIIKLGSNENAFGCSPKVKEALSQLTPDILSQYPISAHHPLHQQLSDHLQVDRSMLMLANGSDSLFGLLLTCFALHQDKHMLTHDYAFSSYAIQAHTLGINVVSTATHHWHIDIDAMLSACSTKTALIFIANPNNPTGLMLDTTDIQRLLDNIPKTTLLVLDEAYYEYVSPEFTAIAWLNQYPNLVITRTFSKAYGLAGLRLGYAIAAPQIIALLRKIHLPFTANIAALYAASAALADQSFIQSTRQTIETNRIALATQLDQHQIKYIPSKANFLTINCQHHGPTIAKKLEQYGIIVRPLHPYGMDTYLRVTIGTTEQNQRFFQAFINVLSQEGL